MQRFVRFAVSSLSAVVTLAAFGADLRTIQDPAKIKSVFPAAAKVRVVNVWATWCMPCVAEMPDLRALDEAFGSEVALVGVSMDDMIPDTKPAKVISFLDKQKITFPNVYYTGSPDDIAALLEFNGELPYTVIYDKAGKILWKHEGRIKREETIALVRDFLRRTK